MNESGTPAVTDAILLQVLTARETVRVMTEVAIRSGIDPFSIGYEMIARGLTLTRGDAVELTRGAAAGIVTGHSVHAPPAVSPAQPSENIVLFERKEATRAESD